jgi:hypothetical protein
MESIKDKAFRYRNLSKDETFQELLNTVKEQQIAVFTSPDSSIDAIDEARSIVLALENLNRTIQMVLDQEAVWDKHNS